MLNAQIVKSFLIEHRQTEWDKFTSTLNFQDRSLYKLYRRLLHKKPVSIPLKTSSGHKVFEEVENSELFADVVESQLENNMEDTNQILINSIS